MLPHAFPRNLVVRIKAEFALQIVRKRLSLRQPPLKVVRSLEAVLDFFSNQSWSSTGFIHCDAVNAQVMWPVLDVSSWGNRALTVNQSGRLTTCCSASLRDDELNNENVTVFFFSLTVFLEILTPFFRWSHKNHNSCVLAAWSGPQRNSPPRMTSCVLSTHDVIRGHNCTYAQRRTCSTRWGAHKQTQASSLVQRVLFWTLEPH